MANENYENVNDRTKEKPSEQHEQQRDNRNTTAHDMLEALEMSMDYARETLSRAFKEIRDRHPESDIGSMLRRFHLAVLDAIETKPLESFKVVFGLIGFAILDSLTDEDKEALRNDSLDNT